MNVALRKKWKATETLLERAYSHLPSPTSKVRVEFEAAVAEYRDFLSHNELGLAFDALYAAATLVPCRGAVWRDLERAAEIMELRDHLPDLRQRFLAAAGEQSANDNG